MPMNIYLVRHGQQTELNRYSRTTSLSPVGIAQAERTGARLAHARIARLFCSDLPRTVQTAQIINQAVGAPLTLLPDLREIHFGEWEGLTVEEVDARYADFRREFLRNEQDLPYPGGECGEDVRKRAFRAMELITSEESDAVVVTHGGVILIILAALIGLPLQKRFRICSPDHCGISRLEYDQNTKGYTIHTINDTAHLQDNFSPWPLSS